MHALLDVYAIHRETRHLDDIKVSLARYFSNGQEVTSLSYFHAKYNNVNIYFVGKNVVKMKVGLLKHLLCNK